MNDVLNNNINYYSYKFKNLESEEKKNIYIYKEKIIKIQNNRR